ncbi:MAG: cupin domain-containing protein [Alphaproteobacteria bacterium]
MTEGHPNIVHWSQIEQADPGNFQGTDEPMSKGAPLGAHLGLRTLGIHHMRLEPGQRTSLPHAESHEEEFVHVISGTPDVWLDGVLHRLRPGCAVGFPAGTGLAHSVLNNTDAEVTLLVVGNADMAANRIVYPVNPERQAMRPDWWHDAPARARGPHDGLSDLRRAGLDAKHD